MSQSADVLDLAHLISQTDAVAEAIESGEWESATKLEIERRQMLERYVEQEARVRGDLEHLRDALTKLQQRASEFAGVVQHHRERIIREACTVRKGRDAVKEYDSLR